METTTHMLGAAIQSITQTTLNTTQYLDSVPVDIPSVSIAQLAQNYPEYIAGDVFYSFVLPVCVVVGLAGNTLSFLVMIQPANRRISCCIYMAALAVTDNFTLFSVGVLQAARFVPKPVLTEGLCKVAVIWGQSFIFCGVIFVVCMTVDRWLAVQFPLKAVIWCSTKRAKITVVIVILFGCLYNTPYYIYTSSANGKQCIALAKKNEFTRMYTWVSIVLNSVVPFTLLIIFNILIIRTIKSRKKFFEQTSKSPSVKCAGGKDSNISVVTGSDNGRSATQNEAERQSNSSNASQTKDSAARERQVTVMLILVSFTLLVLTLPQYTRYVVFALVSFDISTPQNYARYLLTIQVTSTVFFSNNCFNFALYCLGGSKFRQDLLKIFSCWNKG